MKNVAIFDFDNTVILGDSFLPFLRFACGTVPTYLVVMEALFVYAYRRLRGTQTQSLRTFVKGHLLRRLLKSKKPESLLPAAARTRLWQKINPPVFRTLQEHKQNGDFVLIASGSLSLYLPELLRDIPHDGVLCTDVGIENGSITGEMTNGNCVRLRKAERIKAWLEENGPFKESFGYGNYPHDVPMLNLVKHRIIVS